MFLFYLIPFVLIIAADQITKFLAAGTAESFPLIPKVLNVSFVKNTGAAFGMFQGKKWLLVAVALLVFAIIIFYVIRYKPRSKWLMWSLTLITAGGLGNLIDRVALGYVRDMIETVFMRFPVFNVADCAVTVGAVMLALYVLIGGVREEANNDFDGDTGCPQ